MSKTTVIVAYKVLLNWNINKYMKLTVQIKIKILKFLKKARHNSNKIKSYSKILYRLSYKINSLRNQIILREREKITESQMNLSLALITECRT